MAPVIVVDLEPVGEVARPEKPQRAETHFADVVPLPRVRGEQVEDALVLAQGAPEEHFRLGAERLADVVIEVREEQQVG